jgi:hypothetical protein
MTRTQKLKSLLSSLKAPRGIFSRFFTCHFFYGRALIYLMKAYIEAYKLNKGIIKLFFCQGNSFSSYGVRISIR